MFLFVIPVSGGAFPAQLAIIKHLIEHKIKPDLILASSGGNLAAYISAAADWKSNGIDRICLRLSSDIMFKQWVPVINPIVGFFYGSIYRAGDGITELFNDYFTSNTIQMSEIWSGTYDRNVQIPALLLNRNAVDGRLCCCTAAGHRHYCKVCNYLGGDSYWVAQV